MEFNICEWGILLFIFFEPMEKEKRILYTTIFHEKRIEIWVSFLQYGILDSILKTQKSWFSFMSKKYLSEFFGISERAIFENIKKLEEMGYIEKSKNWRLMKVSEDIQELLMFENGGKKEDKSMKKVHSLEDESMKKVHRKYEESSYYNNIYNNNISNNKLLDIWEKEFSQVEKEKEDKEIRKREIIEITKLIKDYCKKFDLIFSWDSKDWNLISLLLRDKEFIKIKEIKNFDWVLLVRKILEFAEGLVFWKSKLTSWKSLYYSWKKILNEVGQSRKLEKVVSKEEQEEAKKKLISSF